MISNRKKYDELKDQVKKANKEFELLYEENEMLLKKENEMQNLQSNVSIN